VVEGAEVEKSTHKRPAHWHISYQDGCAGFTNIPEFPCWRKGVGERVVLIQYCAEDNECTQAEETAKYEFSGLVSLEQPRMAKEMYLARGS
jgi:hypothetical protein